MEADYIDQLRLNLKNYRGLTEASYKKMEELKTEYEAAKKEYESLKKEYEKIDYQLALVDGRLKVITEKDLKISNIVKKMSISQLLSVAERIGVQVEQL